MTPLTAPQARVLDYAVEAVSRLGSFPAGTRIARRLGFRHPSTAYEHLEKLAQKGYLEVEVQPNGWRQYRLSERARARAGAAYPLLGRIPAGPLTDVDQETVGVIETLADLVPGVRPGDYLLEVDGDSMVGAGLQAGTLVVLRPAVTPAAGEICAVWVDGEGGTLKRVYDEGSTVRLVPENAAYAERRVPAEAVRVQGVLVAALDVRRFR